MSMCKETYFKLTNGLPIIGGGFGAFTQSTNILQYFPAIESVIATIIITIIGGVVGYITKMILDRIFCKRKKPFQD